ncbi:MAG TPA: hypothetical protein VEL07_02510 [Planctomycetota bacterium]|nr:hypothetical protein [Planctomycetota bacterium]
MRLRYTHLHVVIALAWLGFAVWLGIGTSLLGHEQAALERQRAADLATRTDLAYQNDRLRAAIDWATSAPVLGQAIRKLGLPLQAPHTVARAE